MVMTSTNNENVTGESYKFTADIDQMMGLIVNTFYKAKEVSIREIISNASDALDKIRYQALTDSSLIKDDPEFKIQIEANPEEKTLIIRDSGIGLTKEEMIQNLGTIATSGTKNFMSAIKAGADVSMIGQFGVGFYSAFLISNRVQVRSKSLKDKQHVWESAANGKFHIIDDSKNPHQLVRGTEIILHLKEDQLEYLEERRIKEVVKKHSEFINYPIMLLVNEEIEKEVTDDEIDEDEDKKEEDKKEDDKKEDVKKEDDNNDVSLEGEKLKKKTRKITEIKSKFDQINKSKPIWSMKPEDVTPEMYNEFYKLISSDYQNPLAHKHFKVEGNASFSGILFIPGRAPFDLFNNNKKQENIKLHARKVFINCDAKELCPEHFSFVKGVIEVDDLPLNISRETLQQNKFVNIIKKTVVKKTIEMVSDMKQNDTESYKKFLKSFGKNLKFACHEDGANRAKLSSFLTYETTKTKKDETKCLDDYIADMHEKQEVIYYITGESKSAVLGLPYLERFIQEDIEVLIMTEPIDEYFVQQVNEYEGKKLQSVTKEGLELPKDDKFKTEDLSSEFETLTKRMKEILGERVEKVEISSLMTVSPCYIRTSQFGWSSRMEQIMKNQALRDNSFNTHMTSKKTLCLNPKNKIMIEINRRFIDDKNDSVSKSLALLLFETAIIVSGGFTLDKPYEYASRIYKLTKLGLNICDEKLDEDLPELKDEDTVKVDDNDEEMLETVD